MFKALNEIRSITDLHRVRQRRIQHGEDRQIGAQVRNDAAAEALRRKIKPPLFLLTTHCLHAKIKRKRLDTNQFSTQSSDFIIKGKKVLKF